MSGTMIGIVPAAWAAVRPVLESSKAMHRRHAQPPCGFEIDVGSGLAAGDVVARGDGFETVEQAGAREVLRHRRLARGGRDGERQAARFEVVEDLDGARLDRHAGFEHPGRVRVEMIRKGLEGKIGTVEIADHAVADRAGNADHRVAESHRHRQSHGTCRDLQGVEIDGFGVDQQAIHVEQDGLDGFREHRFVLSLMPETASGRKIHAHP